MTAPCPGVTGEDWAEQYETGMKALEQEGQAPDSSMPNIIDIGGQAVVQPTAMSYEQDRDAIEAFY